jgi:glycerol-3-phosphate acyltransferase PlsY
MLAMFDWRIFLCGAVPALILLAITRYVSLSAMVFAFLSFVAGIFVYVRQPGGWEIVLLLAAETALLFFRHRSNIRRLLQGTERKLGQKTQIQNTEKEVIK